ncbi:MAG: tRNA 2-thiouridine(34) synthase MnmA [Smithella sp.]|nr:tRNA 2-thiouridine(34) synthase MnmA [Smithella sp.]
MDKVFVAVSGGVDSSASAAILCRRGYSCDGVFMITHDASQAALEDAEKVCETLGIKLHILDFRKEFEEILNYFTEQYRQARTPNPCVLCNRVMKFGRLWDYARQHRADYIATGHYVRIIRQGQFHGLFAAEDKKKDQSYVLSMIRRDTLKHVLFPMADLTKDQTRKIAADFGLHITQKKDSQEICFIPDNDYIGLLMKRCPQIAQPGNVVDKNGQVLGKHDGVFRYTIGQRRGVRIALGQPAYVIGLDVNTHTVILGSKEDLHSDHLTARQVNWLIDKPDKPFESLVKIRYNHSGARAMVYPGQKNEVEIRFEQPVSAITPGQAAVMYIRNELGLQVAGGGWIV